MGGVGSGRTPKPSTQLRDAIGEVNLPKIIKNLEKWSEGREVKCPHCLLLTGIYVPDTIALQSALELLNRRLGKVPQQVQLDITEKIQLTADQVDMLIERYRIASQAQLAPVIEGNAVVRASDNDAIEGEYKEVV